VAVLAAAWAWVMDAEWDAASAADPSGTNRKPGGGVKSTPLTELLFLTPLLQPTV